MLAGCTQQLSTMTVASAAVFRRDGNHNGLLTGFHAARSSKSSLFTNVMKLRAYQEFVRHVISLS